MQHTSAATGYHTLTSSGIGLTGVCACMGLITAGAIAATAGASKVTGIAALAILLGALWTPIVLSLGLLASDTTLFMLAATMSLSIKKHLMPDAGHLGGAIGFKIAITDIFEVGLLAILLLTATRSTRLRILLPKSLLITFSAYFVILSISTLLGSSLRLGLFQLAAYLQAFLLFVFLFNYLTSKRRIRLFVAGLLAGVVLQSGVTILQVKNPGRFRYGFLGAQEEEEHRVVRGKIDLPDVDLGTTTIAGDTQERPTGLLIHPNVLALYLVLSIPVAIGVWLSGPGWWRRVPATVAVALAGVALYYSLSRSGWLALAAALIVMSAVWLRIKPLRLPNWQRLTTILLFAGAACALGLNANRIYLRMTETADEAVYFRRTLNIAALKMAGANPFFGVGLNTFTDVVQQYDSSTMSRVKQFPAHNIVLLETAETGFLGGFAFLAVWGALLIGMYSAIRAPGVPDTRVLAIACFAGLVGFFIGDMSNFAYRIPVLTDLVWAQAAVGLAAGRVSMLPEEEVVDAKPKF